MCVPVKRAKIVPNFIVDAADLASIAATCVPAPIAKIDHTGTTLILLSLPIIFFQIINKIN